MAEEAEVDEVERIMLGFLEHTGVTSTRYPPRRYLWTDAHAVCGLRGIDGFREILVAHQELFSDEAIRESDDLRRYVGHGKAIENFWRRPGNQQVSSWREHQDLNSVMLATSLLPDQCLRAAVAPGGRGAKGTLWRQLR